MTEGEPDAEVTGRAAAPPAPGDDPVGDALLGWALAMGLAWLAFRFGPTGRAWPLAAAGWIAAALGLTLARRQPLADLGLAPRRPLRSAAWLALAALVTLPPYVGGYFAWRGSLQGLGGWEAAPPALFAAILGEHLLLAGLPEEVFFRGYVQARLARRFAGARPRLLLQNPPAVVLAAALFAVTHLAFTADPLAGASLLRLATFFPGLLFGLLRERAGDIWAPALFHALCNAVLLWLDAGWPVR